MPRLTGHYATEHGSKYLQQLCKHFAHKISVDYDATKGRADFVFGSAELRADDTGLTIVFDLDEDATVAPAKGVIDSHLERFAHRENFTAMDWTLG